MTASDYSLLQPVSPKSATMDFQDAHHEASIELTPAGGTPLCHWMACCFPKQKERTSPRKRVVTFERNTKQEHLPCITEETASLLQRDDSIPDMDDDADDERKEVEEQHEQKQKGDESFLQMLVSIVVLGLFNWGRFFVVANSRNRLTNGPSADGS